MQISELMTRTVATIDAAATLSEAAEIMRDLDVGILPVGDRGTPTGMLTDRDIVIRAVADNKDPAQTLVREIITPRVCSIYADQEAEAAAELMAKEQVRRLLVIDHEQRPVGILSLGDLSRHASDGEVVTAAHGVSKQETGHKGKNSHP